MDLMYSAGIIVNDAVLRTSKLQRLKIFHYTHINGNCVSDGCVNSPYCGIITLQYIRISNHLVGHLKLIPCYMAIMSQ